MLVYCGHNYSCVFSPGPVTGNYTFKVFTLNRYTVLLKDNVAVLVTFYLYRPHTLTRYRLQTLKCTQLKS